MAAPTLLYKMRKLKKEEKTTSEILDILKSQLTKLKVEELVLSSKIRELKVIETVNPATMQSPSSQNQDKTQGSLADSEEVNRESLDLTPGSNLLEKLAAGGASLLQNQNEEMEEDDDTGDENNADLFSEKDSLRNFLV